MSGSELRSKLGKVKGLGAAHHGVGHWWWQRLTAVALIPLSLWFLCGLATVLVSPDVMKVAAWFASPVNAVLTVLMLLALFLHAKLGFQVVVEDYVHQPFAKYALLLANVFFCIVLAAVSVFAVLRLHFIDIAAGM